MKIARYLRDGRPRSGVVDGEAVTDLDADGRPVGPATALERVGLLPAVAPGAKFICVGLNYTDHAAEAGAVVPDAPLLFAKLPNSLLASGEAIVLPPESRQVDWEGELGVVIGRPCSRVAPEQALAAVHGYTCVNDVSARDLQFADGQWMRGKSVDTFGPVGPWVTTADEIPDPQDLRITTRVNGEVVQDSSTGNMIFPVAEIVAYVSRTIRLEPGDLIATGTPAGVGAGRDPQMFLAAGDRVEVRIDGVGRLVNSVVDARVRGEAVR